MALRGCEQPDSGGEKCVAGDSYPITSYKPFYCNQLASARDIDSLASQDRIALWKDFAVRCAAGIP